MLELVGIKSVLLKKALEEGRSDGVLSALSSLNKNKKRPLGKFNPWAWCLEPVRGCNLACWHCPVSVDENLQGKYEFMSEETWIDTWKIIKKITPYCRVEMANTGEPTMHPDLLNFVSIAKEISPNSQIQITTNGTNLIKEKITYKELFNAGINIVYVDMYAPEKKHFDLAKDSGYDYYNYYNPPKNAPGAWTYHNSPKIKFIALSKIPDKWPAKKIKRGGLGTFVNNINFSSAKAKKMNITPVIKAPKRRCGQPMKYVQVLSTGNYLMCCQDAFNEANIESNVSDGVEGFMKFWLGKYMQSTRKLLRDKRRRDHPICKKCDIIFARSDMKFWKREMFDIEYES